MGFNIKQLGKLSTTQIDEEIENSKKGKGNSFKGKMVKQSDLPEGKTVMRIIPRKDEGSLPWVRVEEHNFYNKATKGWALFNCVAATGQHCEGCAKSQELKDSPNKMDQEMGEAGRAKPQFFMLVEFQLWGGEPVPKEMQGTKIFKFGQGIYKGSERGVTGGLLGLLKKYPFIQDPIKGSPISITKVLGDKPLDTKYPVDIEKSYGEDEDGNTVEKIVKSPLIALPDGKTPDEAKLEQFFDKLDDLKPLTRLEARNEIVEKLSKFMSPSPQTNRQLGSGQYSGPRNFQRAQDILDGSGEELHGPGVEDDLPF